MVVEKLCSSGTPIPQALRGSFHAIRVPGCAEDTASGRCVRLPRPRHSPSFRAGVLTIWVEP